ncbi:hypothetical protein E0Z10_g3314 [Xylaria hypoxylon]|uniref:Uncharacterized protein n=1 Tax=Xylaria hypoxylon TaxID=37992 RepID=A0A4Z0Z166_9PEZI|nr:hypothetical protein E0Z10_g3314 [Xylaria hypoxylon]
MRRFTLISFASAFFASTLAGALPDLDNLPAPTGFAPLNITMISDGGALEKRQPGGVNICRDINWNGCDYAKQPWDLCIQLDSPWWHSISAIGPDEYNAIVAFDQTWYRPAGMIGSVVSACSRSAGQRAYTRVISTLTRSSGAQPTAIRAATGVTGAVTGAALQGSSVNV